MRVSRAEASVNPLVRVMNRRQLNADPADKDHVGRIHYPGVDAFDTVTLCGNCWPQTEGGRAIRFEDTAKDATCPACINALAEIERLLPKLLRSGS